MQLLPYKDSDAREVVEMWRTSFEYGVGIKDPHPIEEQLNFLVEQLVPQHQVTVGREGSKIVGFMASPPDSVSQLYVGVQSIGRGIGSHLLALAKQRSSGSLWLYTFARNVNARRFYEKHGFREVERESQNMFKLEAIKYVWSRAIAA